MGNISFAAGDWDFILETTAAFSVRSSIVAFDPYVLLFQTNAGVAPSAKAGSSIRELISWLATLDRDLWSPLIVAGDEPRVFAALILYLAGELLPDEEYQTILQYVSNSEIDSDDESVSIPVGYIVAMAVGRS